MSDIFEGDILLTDSPDGGVITVENGLVKCDRSFSTAIYLSLFGGNEDDGGAVNTTRGWWGDYAIKTDKNEIMISRFQHFIKAAPLTSKNLQLAELCAADDLEWLKTEKIADEITVIGKIMNSKQTDFLVEIKKDKQLIASDKYTVQWEAVIHGV